VAGAGAGAGAFVAAGVVVVCDDACDWL
jgi:hypothetical protein